MCLKQVRGNDDPLTSATATTTNAAPTNAGLGATRHKLDDGLNDLRACDINGRVHNLLAELLVQGQLELLYKCGDALSGGKRDPAVAGRHKHAVALDLRLQLPTWKSVNNNDVSMYNIHTKVCASAVWSSKGAKHQSMRFSSVVEQGSQASKCSLQPCGQAREQGSKGAREPYMGKVATRRRAAAGTGPPP